MVVIDASHFKLAFIWEINHFEFRFSTIYWFWTKKKINAYNVRNQTNRQHTHTQTKKTKSSINCKRPLKSMFSIEKALTEKEGRCIDNYWKIWKTYRIKYAKCLVWTYVIHTALAHLTMQPILIDDKTALCGNFPVRIWCRLLVMHSAPHSLLLSYQNNRKYLRVYRSLIWLTWQKNEWFSIDFCIMRWHGFSFGHISFWLAKCDVYFSEFVWLNGWIKGFYHLVIVKKYNLSPRDEWIGMILVFVTFGI